MRNAAQIFSVLGLLCGGWAGAQGLAASDVSVPIWSLADAPFLKARYPGFVPFEKTVLHVGGSRINAYLSGRDSDRETAVDRPMVLNWVSTAAKAVSSYYGKYPVDVVSIVLLQTPGNGIHSGETFSGHLIKMKIGVATAKEEFAQDWTMTHEMFHLGFPDLNNIHLWMNEGEAVYLEPIARVRIGDITVDEMWRGMVEGLPKGLPESGDKGLDHTATWGRTYWGGTLFWFLADVEIRKQTHNKHSIDDAMRAMLNAGGDGSELWPMRNVLDACDAATETKVVSELYAKMANAPMDVDLDALWVSLGVKKLRNGTIRYNDAAPLAYIRKSITDPKSNP